MKNSFEGTRFRLFKVLTVVLLSMLTAVAAVFVGCGSDTGKTEGGGNGEKLRPIQQREGYTTQHEGDLALSTGTEHYSFTSTVHWVKNEESGLEIYGRLFKPADFDESKKYPVAIVCHGFNAVSESETSRIVQNYIVSGMLCYTFDFCGGGNSVVSDGETTHMSVETEISDLEYVVDYVQSLPYADTDKIVLTGKSFGGLVVATEAARHPDEFAGLVLYFPAITIYKNFHAQYPTRDLVEALPDEIKEGYFTYGKQYYLDMFDLGDPLEYINDFDKDVILLQVNEDESVNIDLQRETDVVYDEGEGDCTFIEVDGGTHNFSDAEYLYVMPFVNDYLKEIGVISLT